MLEVSQEEHTHLVARISCTYVVHLVIIYNRPGLDASRRSFHQFLRQSVFKFRLYLLCVPDIVPSSEGHRGRTVFGQLIPVKFPITEGILCAKIECFLFKCSVVLVIWDAEEGAPSVVFLSGIGVG